MGFAEILDAVRGLPKDEIAILRGEIEKIEEGRYANHGLAKEQWAEVLRRKRLSDEGKTKSYPAREVLAELLKRHE